MPLGTARMQMRHLMHLVSVKIPVHLLHGFSVVFSETFAAEITINNQRRQRRNPLAFLPPPHHHHHHQLSKDGHDLSLWVGNVKCSPKLTITYFSFGNHRQRKHETHRN